MLVQYFFPILLTKKCYHAFIRVIICIFLLVIISSYFLHHFAGEELRKGRERNGGKEWEYNSGAYRCQWALPSLSPFPHVPTHLPTQSSPPPIFLTASPPPPACWSWQWEASLLACAHSCQPCLLETLLHVRLLQHFLSDTSIGTMCVLPVGSPVWIGLSENDVREQFRGVTIVWAAWPPQFCDHNFLGADPRSTLGRLVAPLVKGHECAFALERLQSPWKLCWIQQGLPACLPACFSTA